MFTEYCLVRIVFLKKFSPFGCPPLTWTPPGDDDDDDDDDDDVKKDRSIKKIFHTF